MIVTMINLSRSVAVPRQWLVAKGSGGARWSRAAAALLAETLAGPEAIECEQLIASLEDCHSGSVVTSSWRSVATGFVGKRQAMNFCRKVHPT